MYTISRRDNEENNNDIGIKKLIPKILKLLLKVNRSYWITFIMILCTISLFILFTFYNYIDFLRFIKEGSGFGFEPIPIEWYPEIFFYIFFIPFILPLSIIIILYWIFSKKASSISNWKEIRTRIQFFNKSVYKKTNNLNGKLSENIIRTLISIERWLKTLWINRCFVFIFLLLLFNMFFLHPFENQIGEDKFEEETDSWVQKKDIKIWLNEDIASIWLISFFIPTIIITILMIVFYKRQMKIWQTRIQKIKDNYKQFCDEL